MKKAGSIIILSAFIMTIGVSIAYKNTKQLLYDNSSIISFSTESVYIFDYIIDYKDIKKNIEKIKKSFPEEHITI